MRRSLCAAALTFVAGSCLSLAQASDAPWPAADASTQPLVATSPSAPLGTPATSEAAPTNSAAALAPMSASLEAPAASLAAAGIPTPATYDSVAPESATAEPTAATTSVADGIILDDALMQASNYFQAAGGSGGGAKPKYPLIVVSGFAQIDGIWFDQDAANQAVVGDAQDVAEFRRSRLGVKGNLAENVSYKMEYDFAFPGRPNFTDVWVTTSALPVLGNLRVGQWKQPFSMEPATSIREVMFMERSLAFALAPFRQIGIGAFNNAFDQAATWAVSGYRFPTDQFGSASGDGGYGTATRETMVLWSNDAGDVLHLGGSYTYNNPSTNSLRLRSTPEVGFTQGDFNNTTVFPIPFFVDTLALPTDNYQVIGGELAAGLGSLVFQSEIMEGRVDRTAGVTLHFPAGYAQLGYVLTGERRTYDRASAAFTRVVPDVNFGQGGPGAFELAGRYSMLDLNDADVQGGRLQDLTAGLNWYLNKFTRIEFNYIHAILDRPVGNDSNANIFGTRAQFDF